MSSNQSTVDYIVEQAAAAGDVRARKMFGEYGMHCDGKFVACVCDDRLFVKPTAAGRAYIGEPTMAPPYPGAKDYFMVEGDRWEDPEWLAGLIRATAAELPAKKKKARLIE